MKSPKRKFEPQSIGKVLDEIVQSKELKDGITNAKVQELWFQVLGDHMAHYTEKIRLSGNTLFVSLSSAPLREELGYGKEKIIKMINEELGESMIKKLVLR